MKTLRVGETVRLQTGGELYRVALVNESRAYVVPVKRVRIEIHTIKGQSVSFMRLAEGVSISPNSELDRA